MKTAFLVLGIPVFLFSILAIGINLGPILPLYTDSDLTPYLAAMSLGTDHDLAYTREDSDRFFRTEFRRPVPFRVIQKKILNSAGQYASFYAFHAPDLYVFYLAPFVTLFAFHGLLLSQVVLIATIYWTGFLYYRVSKQNSENGHRITEESTLPPLNSLIYHTLVPLPVVFLLPSHHLFLYAMVFLAIFAHLKRHMVLSAILLAIASSSQPLAILTGILCVSYWQSKKGNGQSAAPWLFVLTLIISCFTVWGLERLMYPTGAISDVRWLHFKHDRPLAELWSSLPVVSNSFWGTVSSQAALDFLFGRNTGLFVYGFPAFALFLTSLWLWKDAFVKCALLFFCFYLLILSFTSPEHWNILSFANDHWAVLCPIAFFLLPLIHPIWQGIAIIVPALFLAAPLLVNPLGAHTSRTYYVQSFPYKLFPVEPTLTGDVGILKSLAHSLPFDGGSFYFLNDQFYKESNYFWSRGEGKLELLIELRSGNRRPILEIQNGATENEVRIQLGERVQQFTLAPLATTHLDLNASDFAWKSIRNSDYLHGTIESKSGYVPKLFSRDNPDYRFLGCRIRAQ